MKPQSGILIPAGELAPETLRGVVEEFVTRDGTDMAEAETKIREVMDLLQKGEVEIWFDAKTRTCNIIASKS